MKTLKFPFSEKGSAHMLSLFLVIISCLLLYFYLKLSIYIHIERKTEYICQKELLKTQGHVATNITQLLEMNKKALFLQNMIKSAKATIAVGTATSNPAIVATGIRLYQTAKKASMIVIQTQNYLILDSNIQLQRNPTQILNKIKKSIDIPNAKYLNGYYFPSRLAIEKIRTTDGPPTYQLDKQPTQTQALHIYWNYQYQVSDQESNLWGNYKLKRNMECAASIKTTGQKIESSLIGGKFLSNRLFSVY